jgi:hypothetical protein
MEDRPLPELLATTLVAAVLVYPASVKMSLLVLLVGVPFLLLQLPLAGGGTGRSGARVIRPAEGGGRLFGVVGLTLLAAALLTVSYLRPSLALGAFITVVSALFVTEGVYRSVHRSYVSSPALSGRPGAARMLSIFTSALVMSLYYLGLSVALGMAYLLDIPG